MTVDAIAEGLLTSHKWDANNLTYTFATGENAPSEAMKQAVEEVLRYIESVVDVTFTYAQSADIVFNQTTMDDATTLGYSYLAGTTAYKTVAGDVYISDAFSDGDFEKGGIGYSTIIHEMGHSLGLDHPFGDGYYPEVDIHESVMSYNAYEGYDEIHRHSFDAQSYTSYEAADILALQSLYGASRQSEGDTLYSMQTLLYDQSNTGYIGTIRDNVASIYDAGGTDTLSLADITTTAPQFIDINPLGESAIKVGDVFHYVTIDAYTDIENVTGSAGNDTILLNTLNNTIDGAAGFDTVSIQTDAPNLRIDTFGETVVVSGSGSGFDILQNTEALYINDNYIETTQFERTQQLYADQSEAATAISRLYLAALNRLADKEGLEYWLSDYTDGQSLNAIANSFVNTQEFVQNFNTPQSNDAYITLLYQNVLLREPDAAGLEYWQTELSTGMSEADLLVSFSQSQEFEDLTQIYFGNNTVTLL